MLVHVRCPNCGDMIAVPEGAHPGDLLECPNCAGHALRLTRAGQSWAATLAYHVSCPRCDNILTLPEDVKAGDTIHCCGRRDQGLQGTCGVLFSVRRPGPDHFHLLRIQKVNPGSSPRGQQLLEDCVKPSMIPADLLFRGHGHETQ